MLRRARTMSVSRGGWARELLPAWWCRRNESAAATRRRQESAKLIKKSCATDRLVVTDGRTHQASQRTPLYDTGTARQPTAITLPRTIRRATARQCSAGCDRLS